MDRTTAILKCAFPLVDVSASRGRTAVLKNCLLSYQMTASGVVYGNLFGIALTTQDQWKSVFTDPYWDTLHYFNIYTSYGMAAGVQPVDYTPRVNGVDSNYTTNNWFWGERLGAPARHPLSYLNHFFLNFCAPGIFQIFLGDIVVPENASGNLLMPYMTPFEAFDPFLTAESTTQATGTFSCEVDYV